MERVGPLVFVWQQTCSNVPDSFFGLGDSLRGIVACMQFARERGLPFLCDAHKHPMSNLLKHNARTPYSTLLDTMDVHYVRSLYALRIPSHPIFLYTNGHDARFPLAPEEKAFLRSFLDLKDECRTQPSRCPVWHLRLGDEHMIGDQCTHDDGAIDDVLDALKAAQAGDVVVTDSLELKETLRKERPDLRLTSGAPAHVGKESDPSKLLCTMHDLYLLMTATRIYSRCVYDWKSGFAFWVATAFDIPFQSF